MSVGKTDYLSRLQPLFVFLILNGIAKMKLPKLAFLYCGEIVKISSNLSTVVVQVIYGFYSTTIDLNNNTLLFVSFKSPIERFTQF